MPSKSTTPFEEPSWQLSRPWKPHDYQKKAVKFLLQHAAAGLFLDPGLGKTSIVLAALKLLIKQKTVSKVLIVAPLRVGFSTWPGEIRDWADFEHLTYTILHSEEGDKDELLKRQTDLYIINPEGLDWLLGVTKTKNRKGKNVVNVDVRAFKKLGFDTLVIDELTKFKNHQSDRWKAMKQVLSTFGRRWGLTGSPAANGLEQLFGQFYMLDEGRTFGTYITHYRNSYFLPHPNGFAYMIRPGAEEEIYERARPLVLRMDADDYLKLPTLVTNDIWIDLPEKAFEMYEALEDDLIAQYDGGTLVAKNSGVALGKCRQLASGAIYKDKEVEALVKLPKRGREWVETHSEKLVALKDLLAELEGHPVLIAYEFGHDLERLRAALPDATFVADYSAKEFKQLEDRWNAGELELLVAQASSISHGLNLQKRGNHIIWFTLTWDKEVYDQLIRRLRRQGNTAKHIFVHRLLARNTVDKMVAMTLEAKGKVEKAFFDALKTMRRARKRV